MMSDAKTEQKNPKVGMDDLVEDMFGLNVRGLHTIWAMYRRPARVFETARDPDWGHRRYTPSIRLVFSLLAAMTALRFLWTGEDTYLYQVTADIVFATGDFATRALADAFTEKLMDTFVFAFPLVFMFLHVLAALVLPLWGKGTAMVLRIRLYFLALIPGAVFSLFMTTSLGVTSETIWFVNSILMMGGVLTLDFSTAMRGGVAGQGVFGKIVRATVFALVSLFISMSTNMIAFSISSAWVTAFSEI
ncbi:MAG: hypothetical protein CMK09_04065 [Ponticaulis sp.]|nr:hypothetical protein [Ponticaulis sp.]|tara:strand:- start:14395 stop:15135 length:741 start_codon:yes stop_codon:yes gene_type:complete